MNKNNIQYIIIIKAILFMVLFSEKNTFGQTPGSTYCGPYTSSPALVLTGLIDTTISGLEISNVGNVHCINISNCRNLTITDCKLTNSTKCGVGIENSYNITVVNCRIESVETGVAVLNSTGIKVLNNSVKNVLGPGPKGQLVQFNTVTGSGNKVNYNVIENIIGESYPEDAISLYASSGTTSDPIQVKGNWIRGGGPSRTGGGIMTGDVAGSNIVVEDNILVNPGQYGIAIAGGDNIKLLNNKIYGKQQSFTNVGLYIWNQQSLPCGNHEVSGNEVNWKNSSGNNNPVWNANNCGTVAGWENNDWNANINESILPLNILDAACNTIFCDVSVNGSVTNETDNNSNGSIDILVTGGIEPYTIAWSDGHSSEGRTGLSEGDYTVTVTDQNGCSTSKTWTISNVTTIVDENKRPIIDIEFNSTSLFGGSVIKINAKSSYDPDGDRLSYTWTIPSDIDASSFTESTIYLLLPNVTSPTDYQVHLELSDGSESDTETLNLMVNPFTNRDKAIKVYSSGANNFEAPNIPTNVIDDDFSTRWSAEGLNELLVLSLENPSKISEIGASFFNRQTQYQYFDIHASYDSVNWYHVLSDIESCGFSNGMHIYSFPEQYNSEVFSFIRIVAKGNSLNNWNAFTEIDIYGVSITKGGEVSNNKPILDINYEESAISGTVKELNASGSFDPDGDSLIYHWIAPEGISISSTNEGITTYLVPEVLYPTVKSFVIEISDGIDIAYKTFDITFAPYKPEISKVQVVSVEASYFDGNNHPVNLLDNDPNTYWSANGDNHWVSMELASPVDISHLKVAFFKMEDKYSQFDIYLSNDKENWEPMQKDLKSCGFSNDKHLLECVNYKNSTTAYSYVKLVGHGNNVDDSNMISEFEIFGDLISSTSVFNTDQMLLKVYPNPATQFFTVELLDKGVMSLFDISGRKIFQKYLIKGKHIFPIEYPKGCYFVYFQSDNNENTKQQKLIIK